MTKTRKALILGSTGLVGRHALTLLLDSPQYSTVIAPVRRGSRIHHPKLRAPEIDFSKLAEHPELFQVDVVMSALGSTLRKSGSLDAFRRTDYTLVLEALRLAKAGGARTAILVSAVGASSRSKVFYSRVKGELEDALRGLGFERVHFLRPSLLLGDRHERRIRERLAVWVSEPLTPLFRGRLAKYRPIQANRVAQAMMEADLRHFPAGVHAYEGDQLDSLIL